MNSIGRTGEMQQQYVGVDNSFEQEVEPIQRQLENRFHPMEGVQPPHGMQGISSLNGINGGFNGMQQIPIPMQMQPSNPQQQLMLMQQDLAPLNYENIKHFLANSTEEIKVCATLQALRWRLTKTKRKQLVKYVIHAYQNYDLLGCQTASLAREDSKEQQFLLIDKLLAGPRKVLEYTMTFVNALASECLGRGYLL